MKNLEQLISHCMLATDDNNNFFITTQGIPDGLVPFDLWSASNNRITHILTKWIFVFSAIHAQDIADLWMIESIDHEELVNGDLRKKSGYKTAPHKINFARAMKYEQVHIDWETFERLT